MDLFQLQVFLFVFLCQAMIRVRGGAPERLLGTLLSEFLLLWVAGMTRAPS